MGKELISGVGGRSSTDKNTFKDLSHLCAVAELTCSTFLTIKMKAKPCFISDPSFKKYFCACEHEYVCICVCVHKFIQDCRHICGAQR